MQKDLIEIKPAINMNAKVTIPASKSYTNRALIVSSLAKGISTLKNVIFCDDTTFMIEALSNLGVKIEKKNDELKVFGTEGKLHPMTKELYLGNAGTTVRFITTLATLSNSRVRISGDERMNQRPLTDLIDALTNMGASIKSEKNNGCPPVIIKKSNMHGGEISINCTKSSQYLSSLLMCAPYAGPDISIKVKSGLVSVPYIDMTLKVMEDYGIKVDNIKYRSFNIKSGSKYLGRDYFIEADASSASYFFAAAAVTNGKICVYGLNSETLQGDIKFLNILKQMGCSVIKKEDHFEVSGGKLKGIEVDMNRMPDMVQTLAIVALFAEGQTYIKNVENLRIKETDRLKALENELIKVGAKVENVGNGIKITPGELKPAEIETYEDHRMAMCFSILGLALPGIKIKNPNCVSKSFPNFYEKLNELY